MVWLNIKNKLILFSLTILITFIPIFTTQNSFSFSCIGALCSCSGKEDCNNMFKSNRCKNGTEIFNRDAGTGKCTKAMPSSDNRNDLIQKKEETTTVEPGSEDFQGNTPEPEQIAPLPISPLPIAPLPISPAINEGQSGTDKQEDIIQKKKEIRTIKPESKVYKEDTSEPVQSPKIVPDFPIIAE